MRRKNNTNNKMQKKVSRNNDRAMGRAGLRAANERSAKVRQQGGTQEHWTDIIHLNSNKRPVAR